MILTLIKYCEEISMYLVHIYNNLIFDLFLTFLLFDICVVIRFKLVLGHLCWRIKELYTSGQTCWPWHAEELNMVKQFRNLYLLIWYILYCIYICCFFRFDVSTKKLFASFHYIPCFALLSGCCVSSAEYCQHSVFMIIFRYPDKI